MTWIAFTFSKVHGMRPHVNISAILASLLAASPAVVVRLGHECHCQPIFVSKSQLAIIFDDIPWSRLLRPSLGTSNVVIVTATCSSNSCVADHSTLISSTATAYGALNVKGGCSHIDLLWCP